MGAEPWNVGDNGADAKLIQALVAELRTAAGRLDAATLKLDEMRCSTQECGLVQARINTLEEFCDNVNAEESRSRLTILETQREDSKDGQATSIALVAVFISLGAVLVQVLMSVTQ